MKKIAAFMLLVLVLQPAWSQQYCSNYDESSGWFYQMTGSQDHSNIPAGSYGHAAKTIYWTSCTYNGTNQPYSPCNVTCDNDGRTSLTSTESASTVTPSFFGVFRHFVNTKAITGAAYATAGSVSCASTMAVSTTRCAWPINCAANVTISASAAGFGVSITYAPSSIWDDADSLAITCGAQSNPAFPTPIILNLGGGYHLSLLKDGVQFNFYGDGLRQVSWPEPGANNGFLVLPDVTGMVSTARQMFGNQAGYANGFLQLAQYDTLEEGGNNDGIIDRQDRIWSELRVWVDSNHDGISQPGELSTLDELGIDSFSLKYRKTQFIDDNGNAFNLKGSMVRNTPDGPKQEAIYDVILQIR